MEAIEIELVFTQCQSPSVPIKLQQDEFYFNCLHDTLGDWHCVKMSEASLKQLTGPAVTGTSPDPVDPGPPRTAPSGTSTLQRAALGRLRNLPHTYEFQVSLRKSTFVPARGGRRRPKEDRITVGTVIEKVGIEVTEQQGSVLRVEQIAEGLVSVWNRNYPPLQVRLFDEIIQVNGRD